MAAEAAAALIVDGMVVGLGSGSTAAFAIAAIGRRVAQGLSITGIATSQNSADIARNLGIPLSTLDEHDRIDLTIDGADEVERGTLDVIKGRGGALLREKIVASAAQEFIVVADSTKLVETLGKFPLPVEVIQMAEPLVRRELKEIGFTPDVRLNSDGTRFITDEGNLILDCAGMLLEDPQAMAERLDGIVGVVEHGLFLGMAQMALIAEDGRVIERTA